MKLDEAIHHCSTKINCSKCGQEHKRLAEWLKELKEYRAINYTPEELQLCFNPPEILYVINEIDEKKVHLIYLLDGEQIKLSFGNVYWNCKDESGNCIELPLEGLHEEYFLTREEAAIQLDRQVKDE